MYVCVHVEQVENLEKDFRLLVISGGPGVGEEESHRLTMLVGRKLMSINKNVLCACLLWHRTVLGWWGKKQGPT